jgi:hypothetical protein
MGGEVGYSMTEARHSVMLLGEEFGVHLPRALSSFIASLGPVGAAMEMAFPFLAIVVGATLLLEHLARLKQEGQALTESQLAFGTTVANVLNAWDEKLLEAGIRADELSGNHLAALHKQLELIDRQSLKELESSFDEVAKAADVSMAQLKTSWYQFGAGSAGAKNTLEQFKAAYDSLLAQRNDKGATALLDATIEREQHILDLQKQRNANQAVTGTHGTHGGDYQKFEQASIELKKLGATFDEKAVSAQEVLVGVLRDTVALEQKRAELKASQSSNATQTTQGKMDDESDKAARKMAQAQQKEIGDAQKVWEENYSRALSDLQESERQKIDATQQGSAARLAAIDSAIKEENAKGLQETQFYKGLLTQRVQDARQMAEEQAKIQAEAGKEAAEHTERMAELQVVAEKQNAELRISAMRNSENARVAMETQAANEDFQIKQKALQQEAAALDRSGKDYENKLKQIQNKETELVRQHENQITQIRQKAEEERNARILSADNRFTDEMSRNLTSLLMRHQTFSKMMVSLGDQVVGGMIQNAIKSILADDMTKEHDAAAAARKAFLAGEQTVPGIGGVILGGALAAMAFSSVMAFQDGGVVPGVGKGDTVPAMLEPGEGVLSNKVMDKLSNVAKFGTDNGGPDVHIHHHATYHIQAMDGDGVDRVLQNHGDKFTQHAVRTLRRMNK